MGCSAHRRALRIGIAFCLPALQVLGPRRIEAGPARPPGGQSPIIAQAQAGGLRLRMSIPAGAYFLGELLPITITLTNRSGQAIGYAGAPVPSVCGSALTVSLAGGSAPFYRVPMLDAVPCPSPVMGGNLGAGRSLTILQLTPLTVSGRVSLAALATLATTVAQPDGTTKTTIGPAPFIAGSPQLTIDVAPTPPIERRITIRHVAGAVLVAAPAGASHLLYEDRCEPAGNSHLLWAPLRGPTVREPSECSGVKDSYWTVLVAAQGYMVAYGIYQGT